VAALHRLAGKNNHFGDENMKGPTLIGNVIVNQFSSVIRSNQFGGIKSKNNEAEQSRPTGYKILKRFELSADK
jgi:hypothetical protein